MSCELRPSLSKGKGRVVSPGWQTQPQWWHQLWSLRVKSGGGDTCAEGAGGRLVHLLCQSPACPGSNLSCSLLSAGSGRALRSAAPLAKSRCWFRMCSSHVLVGGFSLRMSFSEENGSGNEPSVLFTLALQRGPGLRLPPCHPTAIPKLSHPLLLPGRASHSSF